MDDSRYIGYLLEKRIMKRLKDPESVKEVYFAKYRNWITEYLNENQIYEVPLFIICNTLYKLPDTFRIRNNSFFVGDFNLFSYFYDWNYILSDEKYHEFLINLCIKQYIESCYLNDEIDVAYWLCLTCDGLENYKKEGIYFDERTMKFLADRTDVQEEFAMIHEAGHYLLRHIDKEAALEQIREMHEKIQSPLSDQFGYGHGKEDFSDLFEECYCDEQAVLFIMGHRSLKEDIGTEECYMLFFKTLLYVYAMRYIDIVCQRSIRVTGDYFDYQLWGLVYRMGNIYNTLYVRLAEESALDILKITYEKFLDVLQEKMKEVRQIVIYIKESILENKDAFYEIIKSESADKEQLIREYLNLLD